MCIALTPSEIHFPMKIKAFFLVFSMMVSLASCNNEEEVTPDNDNPFIGTWEKSGTVSGHFRRITITFNADMTYKYEDYFEAYDPAYSSYEDVYSFDDDYVTMDEVYPYRFAGNSLFITIENQGQGSFEIEYKKK
jgi:hypothetical protein